VISGPGLIRTSIAVIALTIVSLFAPASAQQQPNIVNPTASSVNENMLFEQEPTIRGRITIPDSKAAVLEQPQGREWRGFHENWMPWIGGVVIVAMILLLAVFYFIRGPIPFEQSEQSGQKILRFNAFERFTHWMTAACFIILALSGLNYIFGKRVLLPLIGPDAFSVLSQWAKYAHNFLAWPFMLGVLFMLVVWLRDNIPNRIDWAWIKAGGGLFTNAHPSAERFNAGQKMVFWVVVVGGLAMSISGIMMLFPFSVAGVNGMQITQVIHAVFGVLFVAAMLAHIYIGSIGEEGAYDAMGSGKVDLAWAKAHHDLWVEEQQAKTASGAQIPRPGAAE
jgi:formate dehydrogenase subunit gamma